MLPPPPAAPAFFLAAFFLAVPGRAPADLAFTGSDNPAVRVDQLLGLNAVVHGVLPPAAFPRPGGNSGGGTPDQRLCDTEQDGGLDHGLRQRADHDSDRVVIREWRGKRDRPRP